MPSQASAAFAANRLDVERLWEIHQELAGQGPGRKHDVEVLNRAAIVMITSCWEAYVEDVALEAYDYLVAHAPSAQAIPPKVRVLASDPLRTHMDARKVWDLADGGWRAVLSGHRAAVVERWIAHWNTPKSSNVDELFLDLLGIGSLSAAWGWQHQTPENSRKKLNKYVSLRGQIAHRVHHTGSVYKSWSTDYLAFVQKLVGVTDAKVRAHIEASVGAPPWAP